MYFDLAIEPEIQSLPTRDLWTFLPIGYLLTIAIEIPILVLGLSRKLSIKQRLWCGVWLTACTYPIVVLVLSAIFMDSSRLLYLSVAETFAPLAECILFWSAFRETNGLRSADWTRSLTAIVAANLASFGFGEIMNHYGWFGWF